MSLKFVSKNKLSTKNLEVSLEDGLKISEKLTQFLRNLNCILPESHRDKNFYHEVKSISAPQVGINKRVIVILADSEPLVLINPVIIEKGKEKLIYPEYNPNVSKKLYKNFRHLSIVVKCDNHKEPLFLQPTQMPLENDTFFKDIGLKQSVLAQQQIDLLNNRLLTNNPDIKISTHIPKNNVQKYGRNDKVYIEKDNEQQFIKYKIAEPLIKNEGWKII